MGVVEVMAEDRPGSWEQGAAPGSPTRRLPDPGRWGLRLLVVIALGAAAELLSPVGLGWPVLLVALWLSVTRLHTWGSTVLDRLVPLLWVWIAVLSVVGWVGPFLPWLTRPWFTAVVAAVPFLVRRSPTPWGRHHVGATVREWVAVLLPAAVLGSPFLLHRDLASVVTQLGIGWDTVNHIAVLRATLLSHGVTIVGATPDALLNPGLLGYPSGAHQVWSAWGQTLGLPGDGTADVIRAYPALIIATSVVAAMTMVWSYRRLVPWARSRAWYDLAGLALLMVGFLVTPLAGLWYSGFHNYLFAVSGLVALVGLAVGPNGGTAAPTWVAAAILVATSTMYPLLMPIAGVGALVVGVRQVRLHGRAALTRVLLAAVVAGVCLFPAALPYIDPGSALDLTGNRSTADLLSLTGGLSTIPAAVPLTLLAIALLGVIASPPLRRRMAPAWWVPATTAALSIGIGVVTLMSTGIVGYYAQKIVYAFSAVAMPLAAAGLVTLLVAWRTAPARDGASRRRLLAGLVTAALVVVAVQVVSTRLPNDPLGGVETVPGPTYLAQAYTAPVQSFVTGERVVESSALATEPGQIVVPLEALIGLKRLYIPAYVNEANWRALLSGTDVSASRLLANLNPPRKAGLTDVVCALAAFTHNHPAVPTLLLVNDAATATQAKAAMPTCGFQPVQGVQVRVATLSDPLHFMLADPSFGN